MKKINLIASSIFCVGTVAACLMPSIVSANAEVSQNSFDRKTMDKIGIFLSNFTECGFGNITKGAFIDDPAKMVEFAMCHNWRNNSKSFSMRKKCGKESGDFESFAHIDPKNMAASIKKYLDYDFKEHQTADYIIYDGHTYCIPAGDGEQTPYVYATSAKVLDNGNIEIKGSSYYPDAEEKADDNINVTAVIKPHVWNGKKTWSLVSIQMTDKPFPEE